LAPSHLVFAAVLALMGVARVAELVIARRYAARAAQRGEAPKPEPIFRVMVLLHTVPFWAAPLEVLVLGRELVPAVAVACAVTLVVAGALRVWTLRTLGSSWNVRIVRPAAVVTTGPYRFIRHPNYLVVVLELVALPLFHSAWLTCAVVTALNAFVLARRIPAEERVLSSVPGYDAAMTGKRRFVPGLF
jgi:methyltransferase